MEGKNSQLTKKLEATHSELSQKVFEAQREAEQVFYPLSFWKLCIHWSGGAVI